MASGADTFLALTDYIESLEVLDPTTGEILGVAMPEEAETFKPPMNGRYLQVSDFPNAPLWEGLKAGRIDQGLMQITVVGLKNDGVTWLKQVADIIIAAFPTGLRLGRVKIAKASWQAAPIIGDGETRVPVTISWVA